MIKKDFRRNAKVFFCCNCNETKKIKNFKILIDIWLHREYNKHKLREKPTKVNKKMTRIETIKKMFKKALEITGTNSKNWTRDAENAIWDMAYDWNSEHGESEEIFMCEIYKEDGYEHDGFMIEDDYFCYEN